VWLIIRIDCKRETTCYHVHGVQQTTRDLTPPNAMGDAHPTQGVQPRFPHVLPAYAATKINGLTEAGPGNSGIRSSLALAAETLPRRSGNAFEGASSGGASVGQWQQGDKDALASSAWWQPESHSKTNQAR
jgi:hypothetical protein